MTEPDSQQNATAEGGTREEKPKGDVATNNPDPANDTEVDLDPDEALTAPTDTFDEATPDPDVAEVTDPADPSFVEPATPPEGTVIP